MSRGTRIRIVRPTRAEKCSKMVAEVALEIVPACREATGFFFAGLSDFITAPISESAESYLQAVRLKGARSIDLRFDDNSHRYEELRTATISAATRSGIELPAALVQPQSIVTEESVGILQSALDKIQAADMSGDIESSLDKLAGEMGSELSRTLEAFDAASLVAGKYRDDPQSPVFRNVQELINSPDSERRAQIQTEIGEWASKAKEEIAHETRQSWSATLLAAAKIAMEETGFRVDMPESVTDTIVGVDPADESKLLEFSVLPSTGEVDYELKGYKQGACAPVEKRFRETLAQVLGADFTSKNTRVRDTEAAPPSTRKAKVDTSSRTRKEPDERGGLGKLKN